MRMPPLLRSSLHAVVLCGLLSQPVLAVDPPYQEEMERLSEILGSLYFLQPLCQPGVEDWRQQMDDLITLDQPDEDRRQRLAGAFNAGFESYSRLYRACTVSANEALTRLLVEAQGLARGIHSRYAE